MRAIWTIRFYIVGGLEREGASEKENFLSVNETRKTPASLGINSSKTRDVPCHVRPASEKFCFNFLLKYPYIRGRIGKTQSISRKDTYFAEIRPGLDFNSPGPLLHRWPRLRWPARKSPPCPSWVPPPAGRPSNLSGAVRLSWLSSASLPAETSSLRQNGGQKPRLL